MKRKLIVIIIFLLWSIGSVYSITKIDDIEKMNVDEIIDLLNHSDPERQKMALDYGVSRFLNNEKIRVAVIELLKKENKISEEWYKQWYEEYDKRGEYPPLDWEPQVVSKGLSGEEYLMLVKIVAKFKDEKAISA